MTKKKAHFVTIRLQFLSAFIASRCDDEHSSRDFASEKKFPNLRSVFLDWLLRFRFRNSPISCNALNCLVQLLDDNVPFRRNSNVAIRFCADEAMMRKSRHQVGFLEAPNDHSSVLSAIATDCCMTDGLRCCGPTHEDARRIDGQPIMLPNCITTAAVLAFLAGCAIRG